MGPGEPTREPAPAGAVVLARLRERFTTNGYDGFVRSRHLNGQDPAQSSQALQQMIRDDLAELVFFHGWRLSRSERLRAFTDPTLDVDAWPTRTRQRAAAAEDLRALTSLTNPRHQVLLLWAVTDLTLAQAKERLDACVDPEVACHVLAHLPVPVEPTALRVALGSVFTEPAPHARG